MKKLLIITTVLIGMMAGAMMLSSFNTTNNVVTSLTTQFPTTGTIPVYKYPFASSQKEKIGELRWSATLEDCSGSSFVRVNLRITNTTNEYVSFGFIFSKSNEYIRDEVRPHGEFEKEYVFVGPLGSIFSDREAITLH